MTTTEARVTGFCPCCDKPMWADQYAGRGFRVRSDTGVCNECPADGVAASRPVAAGNVTGRSEQAVGHWAAVRSSGVTMKSPAAQLGLTYPAYWQAVQRAREAGDGRAEYVPRAGVNTRRESGPDWDQILSRWDRELRPAGMNYRQAAETVGVPEKTFTNRLWAARNEGDPRAAKRVGARETVQRDTQSGRATVAGTEWVWTARGWLAPEDVETEGKVETVLDYSENGQNTEIASVSNPLDPGRGLSEVAPPEWTPETGPAWPTEPKWYSDAEQARIDARIGAGIAEYERETARLQKMAPAERMAYEDESRRDQLTTWHADDQAAEAAGDADVAL